LPVAWRFASLGNGLDRPVIQRSDLLLQAISDSPVRLADRWTSRPTSSPEPASLRGDRSQRLACDLNRRTGFPAFSASRFALMHGFADLGRRFLSVRSHRYFPELKLEADALVLELLLALGLPRMVRSDVLLLGTNTELKSCPIPCIVLQPVTQATIAANARIRINMFASSGCVESPAGEICATAVPDLRNGDWIALSPCAR
jgi:hypothetical protein